MSWKKVDTQKTPMWDYKVTPVIEGLLEEVKTNVGRNGSNVYVIKKKDGEEIGVWGSTALDPKMEEVDLGNPVKIEYMGMVTSEKSGRTYKAFEVYTDDAGKIDKSKAVKDMNDEIPVINPEGDEEIDPKSIPF